MNGGTRMVFTLHFPPDLAYVANIDDNYLGSDQPVPGAPWTPGFVGG